MRYIIISTDVYGDFPSIVSDRYQDLDMALEDLNALMKERVPGSRVYNLYVLIK